VSHQDFGGLCSFGQRIFDFMGLCMLSYAAWVILLPSKDVIALLIGVKAVNRSNRYECKVVYSLVFWKPWVCRCYCP
jgi:hypothetical protein